MSQFIDVLSVTPLADGENWRINITFRYTSALLTAIGESNLVSVPAGFVTDFASIPRAIQIVYPVWERYGPAAVLHDWLYWSQIYQRDIADNILREAMILLAVEDGTITDIFNAVRAFGQSSWERNTALKASGYKRTAPIASNPPYAATI